MLKKNINKFLYIIWLSFLVGFFAQPVLAQTDVNIESFISSLFPFIYTNVSVKSDGNSAIDLTRDDFFVYENNILQTDFFEVTPPESGGGVRLTDIVFLIDCSGSMGGEIADVRNNVIDFANALAASSIDYRLGLVRFGYGSGNPYLFNSGNLTGDSTTFRGFVASLMASGGYEPGFMAIQQAITGFNFRPGAQKIFLIITDEDSDAGNKETTINMLLANSITLHAAAYCSSGNSQSHYCNSTSARAATGGLLFGVSSSYNTILDTIVEQASSTYVVRYKSSNPIFDQTVRNVEIFATADSETDSDTVSYIPGAAPEIELTPDTELLKTTPPEYGYNLTISAVITDTSAPYISSAKLSYRPTSIILQLLGIFQSVNMVNTFGDIWEADIPGNIVNSPGVEFYITATDGQTNSSLPKSDPSENPISIAVLPNELPQISHTPTRTGIAGQDLSIVADISDTTHNLEAVKLFYRKLGEIQYTEVGFSTGLEQYQLKTVIPANVVTSYGVEYYIEAMDNLGAKSTKGTRDKPITVGVGFVWQRIEVDGEIYTVIVRADSKPENIESFVYPIFTSPLIISIFPNITSYCADAVAILDSNGDAVTDQSLSLQKKILSLARNAALYRSFAEYNSDPFPIIDDHLGGFNIVSTTPPTKHCLFGFWPCFETDGGRDTSSFSTDPYAIKYSYPGHLKFPSEYQEKNGVAHLVDWDLWKAAINIPALGLDYIHPAGLKKEKHRKRIYKTVLRQLIFQKGVNAFTYEATEVMVEMLQYLAIALKDIPEDELIELGSTGLETAEYANTILELYDEIQGLPIITPENVKSVMEVLHIKGTFLPVIAEALGSPNHYTGLAKTLNKNVSSTLQIFGAALSVIGSVLDTVEIGGDVIMWIGEIFFLYNDGLDIINYTIKDLQNTNNMDPQLLAAATEIQSEFDNSGLEIFFREVFIAMIEGGPKLINYGVDLVQTVGQVAAVVACTTGAGCVPGGIIVCVNIAIDICQGIINYIPNKLEGEELQQAVVLLASLENKWFNSPLKDELSDIDPLVATEDQITRISLGLSCKIYQGIAVSKEIYEENSGFWNMLKDVFTDEEIKLRKNKADKVRERLEDIMFGNGGDTKTKLDRLAGRPRTGFRSYLGFTPRKELNTLISLTNEQAITDYTMEYYLFSPGEIGIIDPSGRRIGTFVQDDGNGNLTAVDFNQIPGANYSGSDTHPRKITIPKSIVGDYEVVMAGNAFGSYTFQAKQVTAGGAIVSEEETTGFFEPGRIEDGGVSISQTGMAISKIPEPRGVIEGAVYGSSTGDPLPGVTVFLGHITTRSDNAGLFKFDNVKPGSYEIKVFMPNYLNYSSSELVLGSGQILSNDIVLFPANIYYPDPDRDGFGSPDMSIKSATPIEGYVENNLDCDDANAEINPNATEICDDGVDNNCDGLIDEDPVPPEVQLNFPQSNIAVQDGVIFTAEASDNCGIANVYFYVREPGGANGIPIGCEDLVATLNESTGAWEYDFDTTQLQDGHYVIIAKAIDTNGNEGWSTPVPVSIRNWAVIELLPNTANNKAGRTMPVKFALRIAAAVDPLQPFVYNQELEIRIYDASAPNTILLQTSLYGDTSTDYRIDTAGELYITNFKTSKTPADYVVEIWRISKDFKVGDFTFKTVK